jgi:hypothetical protein
MSGISFRAATAGGAVSSPMSITVPSAVRPSDTVLVFLSIGDPGAPELSVSTAGVTTPTLADGPHTGPKTSWALYQFTAAKGDAGEALSFTSTVAPVIGILLAYSGAGLLQGADIRSWTAPTGLTAMSASLKPAVPGSWDIALAGNNSGGPPAYSAGTLRGNDGFDVTAGYDSAAAVKTAGGGTWTNNASDVWWGYTLALPPAGARSSIVPLSGGL